MTIEAPMLFYNQANGQWATGVMEPRGNYRHVFASEPGSFSHWTHIAGAGNGAIMFYDANSGRFGTGTLSIDGSFSTIFVSEPNAFSSWTHIVGGGVNGAMLFYNQANGQWATGVMEPRGNYRHVFASEPGSFSHWTHIAGAGNGAIMFYDANSGRFGTGTLSIDGSFSTIFVSEPNAFSSWTHVIGEVLRLKSVAGFTSTTNLTPAPCQQIEQQLNKKRTQLQQLNRPTPPPSGPVVKPGQDIDPELEAERKRLAKEIRQLDAQLTQCFVQHTPPSPVTVRFERLFCDDQDDLEKFFPDVEDDEPYLLVYTLNLPKVTTIANSFRPDARMFKIGPFNSVDSGETVFGSTNVWDANGNPRVITDPDDVTILVAMMEEDDTGADAVRTQVETLMIAEIIKAAPALASDPEGFRFRLMQGMQGAIQTVVKIGIPSQDDRIGPIQQIRLSQEILNRVRRFGSHRFDLNFSSSGARYSATFSLLRG